jgi:ABC-type transport system substrate-binding protein
MARERSSGGAGYDRCNMMFRSLCALLALCGAGAVAAAPAKPPAMSGWSGDTGEADDFLAPNLSCAANKGGVKFCNADFDRLIDRARGETDAEQRNALYREAQAIFKRERPWITMAHSSVYIPIWRDVKGFVMSPNGSVDFEGVWRE